VGTCGKLLLLTSESADILNRDVCVDLLLGAGQK